MKKEFFLVMVCLAFVPLTKGQTSTCEASLFFEHNKGCSSEARGQKCIELDITHSLDKEGKEFVYAWNFGDGTTQRGALTEYCYEKFGTYSITLDLLDPKTDLVIRNELATTVNLLPPIEYGTARFAFDKAWMADIAAEKIFWRIENEFYCGETAQHTFKTAGLHILEIGVIGKDALNENFSGCTLTAVFIKPKP
jgi:hypothetical protein